jgi:hypothetical protein
LIPFGLIAAVIVLTILLLRTLIEQPDRDASKPDVRKLVSLPYVDFVTESEERKKKVGVQIYDKELACPGLNLYWNQTKDSTDAYLIDMEGRVVHQWQNPIRGTWVLVAIDTVGSVICMLDYRIIKFNWQMQILSLAYGRFHHDAESLADGRLLTITRKDEWVQHKERFIKITNDYLTFISPDGRISEEISLFELVKDHGIVQEILDEAAVILPDSTRDILHTNTANLLTRDIQGFCNVGDILVCLRNLDLIFVYDYDKRKIGWQYDGRGEWEYPHEPILLDNGNILIFDNGYDRGYSKIIEFEPLSKRVVWEYKGNPPESFYSQDRGFIQRLANGNTLITESNSGRVFEVTREGGIVWEWFNPYFSNGRRAIVRKMSRYDPEFIERIKKKSMQYPKQQQSNH